MLAIFKREFKAYFISPVGYVVLAFFLLFSGYIFSSMFMAGLPDITVLFQNMFTITLFLVPILTMRLMSEDKRQKVDQALLTAPVKLSSIVLGKFFAALAVFALGFANTLIFQIIISCFVSTNWLVYLGNVVGMLLLGASLIAIGLLISALTESQMVAAVGTFAISMLIFMLDGLAETIGIDVFKKVAEWVSFSGRYNTFISGVFDYSNLIFFVSVAAIFLFLAVRTLEKKRWA
ncbi:MAG: ABC transporter permease [Oscillospiraceae bacterium]|nr:ABC transporter permease [Oscillospiraceae bacterium]